MCISRLLTMASPWRGFHMEELSISENGITLQLAAVRRTAVCPVCGHRSKRLHSRYVRTIRDLPWSGTALPLRVGVRRFVCGRASCPRRIFAEQFPGLATQYARQTVRLREALQQIGRALGGAAGARLASKLGMIT